MAAEKARLLEDRMPSKEERESANQLRQVLANTMKDGEPARLRLALDVERRGEVVLAPALAQSLMTLLRHVASGRAVTIVPTEEMLTTQAAADLLNVSRPHLIKLLEKGEIAHTMVGRHRRVRARDLFDYARRRDAERERALDELASLDADLI